MLLGCIGLCFKLLDLFVFGFIVYCADGCLFMFTFVAIDFWFSFDVFLFVSLYCLSFLIVFVLRFL